MNTTDDREMAETTTLTVRLTKEAKERLDALAESTRRSKAFLAAEAINEYVANETMREFLQKIREQIKLAHSRK